MISICWMNFKERAQRTVIGDREKRSFYGSDRGQRILYKGAQG